MKNCDSSDLDDSQFSFSDHMELKIWDKTAQ